MSSILKSDPTANIIVAGDFNEVLTSTFVFQPLGHMLLEAGALVKMPPTKRYTFVHDLNSMQMGYMFLSKSLASPSFKYEHVHASSWQHQLNQRGSDHDIAIAAITLPEEAESVDSGKGKSPLAMVGPGWSAPASGKRRQRFGNAPKTVN